jgi:hypothetical protein
MVSPSKLQVVLWLCWQSIASARFNDSTLRGSSVFELPTSPSATLESPWSFFKALGSFLFGKSYKDRQLQATEQFPCRPARQPGVYDVTLSLPPTRILECVRIGTEEVFQVNTELVSMSFGQFVTLEVLLVTTRRGPSEYLEVINYGDYAHYEALRTPRKRFSDHSCLNQDEWCHATQVTPIDEGLLVVDQHRVILYNYTWIIEGNTPASEYPKVYVSQFGTMNVNRIEEAPESHLYYPTAVAMYKPYNETMVRLGYEITSLIPHANSKLLFVTDTGSHRVIVLNATLLGQLDYIGQFGETGVPHLADNYTANNWKTGLNWPYGIAVHAPAPEALYEPTYANVFVVDRRNHRLVKLNLGYPLLPCENENDVIDQTGPLEWNEEEEIWYCRRYDQPRLSWGAEYGRAPDELGRPRGLTDPVNVGIYRHYVVVSEAEGNAITLLTVNHHPPYGLEFVSYFKPQPGISIQGGMAVSHWGYIWYNYLAEDSVNYFGSMFLPESLRESPAPNRFDDYLATCVNTSWYNNLVLFPWLYLQEVGFILNASRINWVFPDRPDFFDIYVFNRTDHFSLDLLDTIVFNETGHTSMTFCAPPTTPTPPPFLGGNDAGWVIDGVNQAEFVKRNDAPEMLQLQARMVVLCTVVLTTFSVFHF